MVILSFILKTFIILLYKIKIMTQIKGIFAAGMSILNKNLSLNIDKTILHAEKLIMQGCHGVAIFGSTGQAQLISVSEKIELLNHLSISKFKNNYLIGTGFNSLSETINLMKVATSLGFNDFLIMPPAYYKYGDKEVIDFYSKIIESLPSCKIILYNFEKLSGYKFSISCIEKLVKKFPKQIIGVKDSSYNLYKILKIPNFSILPGSELKLLECLEIGCHGIITATCNVTAELSRKVYDDFFAKKNQIHNEKLCKVRRIFDQFNLISGLHAFMSDENIIYKNLLPPISILNNSDKKKLISELDELNFNIKTLKVE
jgi:4-hydroxy-tetrahydrodipicolinate synthase